MFASLLDPRLRLIQAADNEPDDLVRLAASPDGLGWGTLPGADVVNDATDGGSDFGTSGWSQPFTPQRPLPRQDLRPWDVYDQIAVVEAYPETQLPPALGRPNDLTILRVPQFADNNPMNPKPLTINILDRAGYQPMAYKPDDPTQAQPLIPRLVAAQLQPPPASDVNGQAVAGEMVLRDPAADSDNTTLIIGGAVAALVILYFLLG